MRRSCSVFVALLGMVAFSQSASAELLYPAQIDVSILPDVDVANGYSFFSQSDTPNFLNLFMTGAFTASAGQSTQVGTTLSGPPPFGVYATFSSQHEFFIGTYTNAPVLEGVGVAATDVPAADGVLVLLKAGVGIGATFEEIFPGYLEADVLNALIAVGNGDNDAQSLLFNLASSSLAVQPEWIPRGENEGFFLDDAHLVKFSDGTAAGSLVSSSYFVTGGPLNPVPEPGSIVLALLGVASFGLVARRRRATK